MDNNQPLTSGLRRRQVLRSAFTLGAARLVPAALIAEAPEFRTLAADSNTPFASNLVGWMITYQGSSSGPFLGSRLYSSAGFAPRSQVDAMAAQPFRHLRFSANGGWVIICDQNTLAFSQDVGGPAFPQDAHDLLQSVSGSGNTVLDIFLTPTNDFVIKSQLSDGTRSYLPSKNFNVELLDIIQEYDPPSGTPAPSIGRVELLSLVFPPPPPLTSPTPAGLQSTAWNACIVLFDDNKYQTLNNPPQDVINQLAQIGSLGDKATNILYTSATGWIVTTARDARYSSGTFDPIMLAFISQLDQDQHEAGYALALGDIVIEVPVRNVSFQVLTIDVLTTRSGFADYSDTLVGQIWIGVDNQPTQIAGAEFGNEVKANTVLGYGGVQTSSRPQSGSLKPIGLPAELPTQFAMSVGPVQILDPRSNVTFGFMLVNNGSQNFSLGTVVATLAKSALGLVANAVTGLIGQIGIPGIGSITSGLINGLGNGAFPSSGCDGLCAMDTFNLSGGAVMAIDYQATNGLTLTQKSSYNNTVFSDSLLSGKSPYDPNSNSPIGCQTSNYVVTTAVFQSNSEVLLPTPFGAPITSGKTEALSSSMMWPPAQTINGTDSTPQALAACVFSKGNLNMMYLFWCANDQTNNIYFSASGDGVTWPPGKLAIGQTGAAPVACVYTNGLDTLIFTFWVANNGSNKIYYGITRDGATWGGNNVINSVDTTPQPPAACVFLDKLFLFWVGNDQNHQLFLSSYAGFIDQSGFPSGAGGSGDPWPAGKLVQYLVGASKTYLGASMVSPSACVFNSKLYVFWVNSGALNQAYPANAIMFSTSTDGETFSTPARANSADVTPSSLAVCNFQNQLFLIWQANDGSNSVYFSSSWDGNSWPNGQRINAVDTSPVAPTVCAFLNYISLFWKANDTSNRIFSSASQRPIWMGTTP